MTGIVEALAISAAASLITAGLTYALTPAQQIEGQRIQDLTAGKSNYGAVLPYAWGTVRVGGNLVWTTFLEEKSKKEKQGKGQKVESETYQYFGYFAAMFSDCRFRPLSDIPRLWMNKKLVFSKIGGAETISEGGKFASQYLRFYYGVSNQVIDPLLHSRDPISNYNYGIPANPEARDAFLISQGIDPNLTDLTPAYNYRSYVVAERLPLEQFYNSLPQIEAEIVASQNCTVGQIFEDIFGIFFDPSRIDTSLISSNEFAVDGFFINSISSAKQAIQNLQQAYFIDIIQSGDRFKFIPLNHPRNVVNLDSADLAAHISGNQKPLDYEIFRKDPTTLPSKVIVEYIDGDLNYDVNQQESNLEVRQYYNENIKTLTLSVVMSATQAATIADRIMFLDWLEDRTYKFTLPTAFLDLEPADLVNNLFDETTLAARITKTRVGANLIVECEAVPHEGILANSSFWGFTRNIESGDVTVGVASYRVNIPVSGNPVTVTDTSGNTYTQGTDYNITNGELEVISTGSIAEGTELVIPTTDKPTQSDTDIGLIVAAGDTQLKVLDIPLIDDNDADFTLYVTGSGGSNWTGASIYVSTDDSRYTLATAIDTYGIFGTCLTTLGATGNVTVQVNYPELEAITNKDLDLGFNLALIGNEIVQVKTPILIGTNTYDLTELTRGLRGTEAENDQHQPNEDFVLLRGDNAELAEIIGSAADIGQVRYFKALSSGQILDEVSPTVITIQGIAQRPYSPINLAATKDGVGNITITWDRRDRHDATNTVNPPLSEDYEQYTVELVEINNGNAVVRSSIVNDNTYTYTTTDQITDFGSLQTAIDVRIAQVSASYGNGVFAEANLTPSVFEPAPTITSFTPASTSEATLVTLSGESLAQVTSVTILGITQDNLAVIDNENLTFNVASGTTSGAIVVTTPGGSATSSNPLIIIDEPPNEIAFPSTTKTIILPYNLIAGDKGKELIINAASGVVRIPDTATGFDDGWGCWISLDGSGSVTFERASGGSSGIIQPTTLDTDETVKLWHRGSNIWKVD